MDSYTGPNHHCPTFPPLASYPWLSSGILLPLSPCLSTLLPKTFLTPKPPEVAPSLLSGGVSVGTRVLGKYDFPVAPSPEGLEPHLYYANNTHNPPWSFQS